MAKQPVKVKVMSVTLSMTIPKQKSYGSIKPSFGVTVEVPAGADPDHFRRKILMPWVEYNFFRLLKRSGTIQELAEQDLPDTIANFFEKHPAEPKLEFEPRVEGDEHP